jgi:hypothetical protein
MKSNADRIKRAISDLNKIDVNLLFPEAGMSNMQNSEEEALLLQLKAAVDDLRTSMWCRMRVKEKNDGESKRLVEFHRMRKVANLLRQARRPSLFATTPRREASLIERFENMAEETLRDHTENPLRLLN